MLHVVTSTQRRGAQTFAVDLVAALARSGTDGEIVALTGSDDPAALSLDALGSSALAPPTLRALRQRARGAAVVVAHGSRTLPACALALAGGPPFVYRSIGDPAAWSSRGLRRARTALALRRAAAVVALWPGGADVLHDRHGVPRARLHVIANGVDASRLRVADDAARGAARARFGIPPGAPTVAVIGALSSEKQVTHAIDAVIALADVHLLVAGDGPERADATAAATAALGGRAHVVGSVDDVGAVLAAADVVALPSRTEGMPGALIEAGLVGRPAVAYDVGAVREVVLDSVTGRVVARDDIAALREALTATLQDRDRLGAAARDHCLSRFEIGAVAARWTALISSLAP